MVKFTRIFDGKKYHFHASTKNKSYAQQMKRNFKSRGAFARVIKIPATKQHGTYYAVYTRGRKK